MKDKYIVELNEKEIRYLGYTMSMHLQKMEDDRYYGNRDLTLLKNLVSKINQERYRDLNYIKRNI